MALRRLVPLYELWGAIYFSCFAVKLQKQMPETIFHQGCCSRWLLQDSFLRCVDKRSHFHIKGPPTSCTPSPVPHRRQGCFVNETSAAWKTGRRLIWWRQRCHWSRFSDGALLEVTHSKTCSSIATTYWRLRIVITVGWFHESTVSANCFFFFHEKWPVKQTDVSKATHIGRTLRDSAEAAVFLGA